MIFTYIHCIGRLKKNSINTCSTSTHVWFTTLKIDGTESSGRFLWDIDGLRLCDLIGLDQFEDQCSDGFNTFCSLVQGDQGIDPRVFCVVPLDGKVVTDIWRGEVSLIPMCLTWKEEEDVSMIGRSLENISVKNLQHSGIATLWKSNATPRYYCLQCGLLHKTLLHTLRAHGAHRSSCRYVLYGGPAVLDPGSMTILRFYHVEYIFLYISILCIRLHQFPINLDLPKQLWVQKSTRIFCWSQCLDLNGFGTLSQKARKLGWIDGRTLRKDSFSKQVLCLDDWVESTPVKAEIHRFIEPQLVFEHAIDIDLHF